MLSKLYATFKSVLSAQYQTECNSQPQTSFSSFFLYIYFFTQVKSIFLLIFLQDFKHNYFLSQKMMYVHIRTNSASVRSITCSEKDLVSIRSQCGYVSSQSGFTHVYSYKNIHFLRCSSYHWEIAPGRKIEKKKKKILKNEQTAPLLSK